MHNNNNMDLGIIQQITPTKCLIMINKNVPRYYPTSLDMDDDCDHRLRRDRRLDFITIILQYHLLHLSR